MKPRLESLQVLLMHRFLLNGYVECTLRHSYIRS